MKKIQELHIGKVCLPNPFVLAPMAGVSDLPFRLLCHEYGAGLVCMEMVSAKAIFYNNKNTEELMRIVPEERPVSLQLFGSEPDLMGEMAKKIEEKPFDILDINMGCPVPKVVNNGEGSALMKDPVKAGHIIESVVKSINKPVTVKIRKGFDDEHVNAVEIAKIAWECGADAITVHGRTRVQMYSGKADWDIIREVREAVGIPVIGNGDIFCPEDAERMLETTGCDGVAVGRGAQGNPFIFKDLKDYFDHGTYEGKPGEQELFEVIKRHLHLEAEYKGEYTAVREMRKHIAWYTAGLHGSASMRRGVNSIETMEDMEAFLAHRK